MASGADPRQLQPLPFHQAIVDYLQSEDAEIWNWLAEKSAGGESADAVRLDLLKKTYRLDPDEHEDLYKVAGEVASRLGIDAPVTCYQAQSAAVRTASLAYLPGEIHLVLHGPVLQDLTGGEMRALIGHELAHYQFYDGWDGRFLHAANMLAALSHDIGGEDAYGETARLFDLHTEIFCDRGGLCVADATDDVITMLVKIETGLARVNAEKYVRQAEEIFNRSEVKTEGLTHPECFVRTRALRLWQEQGSHADEEIARMITGKPALGSLDLITRVRIAETTRRLIRRFLAPRWMRSEINLAQARTYFPDFSLADSQLDTSPSSIPDGDQQLRDYWCYVLLDFATADRDLEFAPLALAIELARKLGLSERFEAIAVKEMGLRKKQFAKITREAGKLMASADLTASLAPDENADPPRPQDAKADAEHAAGETDRRPAEFDLQHKAEKPDGSAGGPDLSPQEDDDSV